jgi:hypothetical protein
MGILKGLCPLSGIPKGRALGSALLLLVLGVFANDHNAALALDDLAILADGFDGRPDFHGFSSLRPPGGRELRV